MSHRHVLLFFLLSCFGAQAEDSPFHRVEGEKLSVSYIVKQSAEFRDAADFVLECDVSVDEHTRVDNSAKKHLESSSINKTTEHEKLIVFVKVLPNLFKFSAGGLPIDCPMNSVMCSREYEVSDNGIERKVTVILDRSSGRILWQESTYYLNASPKITYTDAEGRKYPLLSNVTNTKGFCKKREQKTIF